MNEQTTTELLSTALHAAADVVRTKLGRELAVVEGQPGPASSYLRFDLAFTPTGRMSWFISNEDATGFSDMLIGGAGDRGAALTEMHLDALTAATSEMLDAFVNGMAGGLTTPLQPGDLDLGMAETLPDVDGGGVRVMRSLEIDGFGSMPIIQHVDSDFVHFVGKHSMLVPEQAPAAAAPAAAPAAEAHVAAPFAEAAHTDNVVPLTAGPVGAMAGADVRSSADLEMLMNVPLPLTVELGHTQRTIRQLVEFSVGSIIELGKLAGDPLDIKVNDRTIARGEVVVIDEEFGIRITEIMSPEDRLRGIG